MSRRSYNTAPAQKWPATRSLAWCLEFSTCKRSLLPACRGSFLYFSGSRAFQQVLLRQHNVLQRHALLLKAVLSPLDDNDRDRLEVSECLCKAPCAGQALSELYACALLC